MDDLTDESGLQKSGHLLADEGLTFRGLPPYFLPDRPCARPHGKTVLNQPPGDPGHIRRSPCEDVSVCPQEGDERVFLFAVQKTTDPCGLGRAVAQGNLLDRDLVACDHPLPRGGGDGGAKPLVATLGLGRGGEVVRALLHTSKRDFEVAIDRDGATGAWHLHLEIGIVDRRHELHQRGPPQDRVVGQTEVRHIEVYPLRAEVGGTTEGDREVDMTQWPGVPRRHTDDRLGRPEHHPQGLDGVKGSGGKDVEGCTPVYEDTPQLHIADGGGNHHRDLSSPGNARRVVGLVEGEGNLRPPRPPRRLIGRGRGQKLSLHGLEAPARSVSARSPIDGGDGGPRLLEPQVIVAIVDVLGGGLLLGLTSPVAGGSRRGLALTALLPPLLLPLPRPLSQTFDRAAVREVVEGGVVHGTPLAGRALPAGSAGLLFVARRPPLSGGPRSALDG